jgi:hypothetical protein
MSQNADVNEKAAEEQYIKRMADLLRQGQRLQSLPAQFVHRQFLGLKMAIYGVQSVKRRLLLLRRKQNWRK